MKDSLNEIDLLRQQNIEMLKKMMELEREKDFFQYSLREIQKSFTYCIGRFITYVPRKIIQKLKNPNWKAKQSAEISVKSDDIQFQFTVQHDKLCITHAIEDTGYKEYQEILLKELQTGRKIKISMYVSATETDRILWSQDLNTEDASGILCCFTNTDRQTINLMLFQNKAQMYKQFVHFQSHKATVRITRGKVVVAFVGGLNNEKEKDLNINVEYAELVIDSNHRKRISLGVYGKEKILKKIHVEVPVKDIVAVETVINNPIHIAVMVEDTLCTYNLGRKRKKQIAPKFHYVPVASMYYKDWALFVRKNIHQNYSLVVRRKDPQEYQLGFKLLENKMSSCLLYYMGKLGRHYHKKHINLYFEKNSSNAEEGTYQIFETARESSISRNYYILNTSSEKWRQLSHNQNVVAKYSLKYYFLLYASDYLISTETSSHLNIHRAMNYYIRKALLERPLIFLQHGVTYLKRQGAGSVFGKGKEGEPTYMVVGSEKEKWIICEMLKLNADQCIKTGLPIFSTIPYKHINEKSQNIVTVMLTWKPSEEHLLSHFETSFYYKNTKKVYELLASYLPSEQVRIVPHPKVLSLLLSTDIKRQIWSGTVAEALRETKLLITDYSSVCYNAFYQGASVIFYQPDLHEYELENEKLIPMSEEYVGYRVFHFEELQQVLQMGISDGKINMDFLRTPGHEEQYRAINEFEDGRNIERIIGFLKEKRVI